MNLSEKRIVYCNTHNRFFFIDIIFQIRTRGFYILLFLFLIPVFYSCTSKEKKAEKLIQEYMSNNLDDLTSYESVRTTVDTIYNDILHNDSALLCAAKCILWHEEIKKYSSELDMKKAMMDIWAIDPYSSYSRSQIKNLYLEGCEIIENMMSSEMAALKEMMKIKSINDTIKSSEIKEWEVKHTFRVKNDEGVPKLHTYCFRMSKDYKILELQYEESDDYEEIHNKMIDCIQESIEIDRQELEKLIVQFQERIDSNKNSKSK